MRDTQFCNEMIVHDIENKEKHLGQNNNADPLERLSLWADWKENKDKLR